MQGNNIVSSFTNLINFPASFLQAYWIISEINKESVLAAPPFASHKKHIRLNIKIVVTFITRSLNVWALIQEKNCECFFDKN